MIKEGLKPFTKDERDFKFGAVFDLPKLEDLPDEYFIEPLSIKNQIADDNDDFCASCAGAGMIEPKENVVLFYPYIFAAAKFESGDDPDSWGLGLRDVGKAMTKWGVPEEESVPEKIKTLPPPERRKFANYEELKSKAMYHKAKTYFFIDGSYDHFDNVRASIFATRDKKQQAMFGVDFGWSPFTWILDGIPKGYGHAMWCSGWTKEGLIAVNSVGRSAGKDGRHIITRDAFNHFAEKYGIMMLVDMSRGEAEYYINNNIKPTYSWIRALWITLLNIIGIKIKRV